MEQRLWTHTRRREVTDLVDELGPLCEPGEPSVGHDLHEIRAVLAIGNDERPGWGALERVCRDRLARHHNDEWGHDLGTV
eukprot:CAMPEP_0185155864 /NCGR_PEP_ID=MMETSP1139-20130426/719_1 /TAXON_ID=298111 /ORGANISM="Pavlova sp., Strain CCMP459" /LENGTH=79 /DNA_ID=CAMNT_0027720803 /DNA_START=332 /DNA_END=571 /DNA_ORIENTATION=+